MKKLNCLSIEEKENTRLIYREKTILGKAEYHYQVQSRLPVPNNDSTSPDGPGLG